MGVEGDRPGTDSERGTQAVNCLAWLTLSPDPWGGSRTCREKHRLTSQETVQARSPDNLALSHHWQSRAVSRGSWEPGWTHLAGEVSKVQGNETTSIRLHSRMAEPHLAPPPSSVQFLSCGSKTKTTCSAKHTVNNIIITVWGQVNVS